MLVITICLILQCLCILIPMYQLFALFWWVNQRTPFYRYLPNTPLKFSGAWCGYETTKKLFKYLAYQLFDRLYYMFWCPWGQLYYFLSFLSLCSSFLYLFTNDSFYELTVNSTLSTNFRKNEAWNPFKPLGNYLLLKRFVTNRTGYMNPVGLELRFNSH